jgi:hypothetical protein
VKTDTVVKDYSKKAELNAPSESDLEQSKKEYQASLIQDLFNFQAVQYAVSDVSRTYLAHENTLTTAAVLQLNEWAAKIEAEVISMGKKFMPQLQGYFLQPNLPEDNEELKVRLQKASAYFCDKISKDSLPELQQIPVLTDSQAVKKTAVDNLMRVEKLLYIKNECFKAVQIKFSAHDYSKTRANADMDFEKIAKTKSTKLSFQNVPKDVKHPQLYGQIQAWRQEEAQEAGINPYEIVPTRTIAELVEFLPTTSAALLQIKGIGPGKVKRFGGDIIDLIENYCVAKGIQKNLLITGAVKRKPVVSDTKKKSFDFFKAGRSIDEIALTRSLTPNTIEGHVTHFIGTGELDIFKIIEQKNVAEIEQFFTKNKEANGALAKTFFGEKYSYENFRMVRAYMNHQAEKSKPTS